MTVPHLSKSTVFNHVVKPTLYDLKNSKHLEDFQKLVRNTPNLIVSNNIDSQLKELMQINHPKKTLSEQQALKLAEKHVGHSNFMTYGNWFHFNWLNTLVHLLPEEEFIKTRTSRNNYKISPEEQHKLSTKKVGVIGLSVGQSISITMAMERTFGEIRIADFDELELTNLNRIRAGVHELGLPKVALVAREIAEIDPYLRVKCFWEGITEDNIDDFLLGDGKLDLVADECDTIHIKFLARIHCKNHEIPVIMDTSDRGMVDIERFDLEPERNIFHGLVNHLDIEKSKNLKTTEDKMTYALPIIGLEDASTRIKASMLEINQSITTWPQLSSDVALGGAISTNVIRRIFLNQLTDSGRYYVDTNAIIPNSDEPIKKDPKSTNTAKLENSALYELAKSFTLDPERVTIEKEIEHYLLESALHAPSGANCQPWKWLISENAYYLFHDKYYSESFNDFNDLASYLSLGCAAENFIIAAQNKGLEVKMSSLPFGTEHKLKAVFQLFNQDTIPPLIMPHESTHLAPHIFNRHTNRNKGSQSKISSQDLLGLEESITSIEGASLRFVHSKKSLDELGELIAMADKIKMLHPQAHEELFKNEIRFTEEDNLKNKDGIDIDLVDLTENEKLGVKLCGDSQVMSLINTWSLGEGLGKMSKDLIDCSSAIGFLTIDSNNPIDFFNGGRAVEKAWLKATELNLAFQPMTILPYYFTRLLKGKGEGFSSKDKDTLTHMWIRFNAVFPTPKECGQLFLFRLSEAKTPTKQSLRRPYNDIVCT